tara:strand:- start:1316 stop:1516 length:201 start_codon:yes stop_codon:yes gene_type:complete
MGCEYYESCNLRQHTPWGQALLGEYVKRFCYGGDDAVSECQHRSALIKIGKLEEQLAELKSEDQNP